MSVLRPHGIGRLSERLCCVFMGLPSSLDRAPPRIRDHDLPSSTGESPAMITSRRAAASPVQPMIEAVSHFASYLAGLSQ